MSLTYETFLTYGIDLSPLGVERRETHSEYFCTPKDAFVLGWAGVDGIHYCTAPQFGELVFGVYPMNLPGDYIRPLAASFEDFLRLLLTFGDAALLEQICPTDDETLCQYHEEYPPTPEQQTVMAQLREKCGLTPLENPFRAINDLRERYDFSSYGVPDDVEEAEVSEEPNVTRVAFGTGFWSKADEAGKPVPINKSFHWAGRDWLVPTAYLCNQGLVIDLCMAVDAGEARAYVKKWEPFADRELSDEEQECAEAENPLEVSPSYTVRVNGVELRTRCGYITSRLPEDCHPNDCLPNETEAQRLMEHYGLDRSLAWRFERVSFPWTAAPLHELKTLELTLTPWPVSVPGEHITVSAAEQRFSILDPRTGRHHTLRVAEYSAHELEDEPFPNDGMVTPRHFHIMGYMLEPELSDEEFRVLDCERSDPPRRAAISDPLAVSVSVAATVGVIGGADGPTALFLSPPPGKITHSAVSSMHFEPRAETEWRTVFLKRDVEPFTVKLIEVK